MSWLKRSRIPTMLKREAIARCLSGHTPKSSSGFYLWWWSTVHLGSVTQLCLTLCDPKDRSTPGPTVHQQLLELAQTHVHPSSQWYHSNHLVLSRPLLLPSMLPSIRVFSNESVLCIRWPKYWSFSFSISPSNEYSGPISFGWTGLIF